MNRRAFLLSLPFIPAAVKAVVTMPAAQVVVPKNNPDLDELFNRLYAVKRERDFEHFDMIVDQHTAKALRKSYANYYRNKYAVAA